FSREWSSDLCSSDLVDAGLVQRLQSVVCGIKFILNATIQRLQSLNKASINRLQVLGVAGHVVRQKAQELAKHRVVTFGGFGAGKQYLAVRPDGVVDLVSLAKSQGATHGFRHRGQIGRASCSGKQ